MKLSTSCILICLLYILPANVYANCFVDNTKNIGGANNLNNSLAGQQFIACTTGNITEVQVHTSGGTIELYLVNGDGSNIIMGSPYQSYTSQPAGLVSLKLATPFPVDDQNKYALAIGNVTSVTFDSSPVGLPANSSLDNGQFAFEVSLGNVFNELFVSDLVFGVVITAPIPATLQVIPSLSSWGLLIFCLLILNLSLLFLRIKQITIL